MIYLTFDISKILNDYYNCVEAFSKTEFLDPGLRNQDHPFLKLSIPYYYN